MYPAAGLYHLISLRPSLQLVLFSLIFCYSLRCFTLSRCQCSINLQLSTNTVKQPAHQHLTKDVFYCLKCLNKLTFTQWLVLLVSSHICFFLLLFVQINKRKICFSSLLCFCSEWRLWLYTVKFFWAQLKTWRCAYTSMLCRSWSQTEVFMWGV